MALLKRFSDSFWSYVSPTKTPGTDKAAQPRHAPATAPPKFQKLSQRGQEAGRRGSIHDIVRHSRSMSPSERVDSWRVGSSSRATTPVAGRKRKADSVGGVRRKSARMEYDDGDESMQYASNEVDDERDDEEMAEYDEEEELESQEDLDDDEMGYGYKSLSEDMSHIHVRSSRSPRSHYEDSDDDQVGHDDTTFLSEADYFASPKPRKLITLPEEHLNRGVSTEELRAQGWDDDHITLVQKIATRGFEPLLPKYYKWDFRYMPDNLFTASDEEAQAFITSVKGKQYRAIKALEKFFELGGRMRDRIVFNEQGHQVQKTPEQDAVKYIREYVKWAAKDSDLDSTTSIPLIALECKPADTDVAVLSANVQRKMARLHARYTEALRATPSIENSPSTTSTKLHYPVPQIYGVVASHTLIVIVAYRPDTPEDEVRNVAFFDMRDKDFDVWNALALAILVNHTRNVQLRVAEEAGVGAKGPDWRPPYESDPDL